MFYALFKRTICVLFLVLFKRGDSPKQASLYQFSSKYNDAILM